MSGDPKPPRLMPPDCCPFHESGGHWDSGHSQRRAGGNYGDPPDGLDAFSYAPLTAPEWSAAFGDMWGYTLPCEARRSRDQGGGMKSPCAGCDGSGWIVPMPGPEEPNRCGCNPKPVSITHRAAYIGGPPRCGRYSAMVINGEPCFFDGDVTCTECIKRMT